MSKPQPTDPNGLENIVVVPNMNTGTTLHIPDADGDPLCEHWESNTNSVPKVKPLAVYPPDFRTWCSYCVEAWER